MPPPGTTERRGNFLGRSYHDSYSTPHFVRFLTSWILPPFALASIRLLFAAYIFGTLFTNLGVLVASHSSHDALRSFSYFTILGYWGLGFYFLVSAYHGFTYARRGPHGLSAGPMTGRLPEKITSGKRKLRFLHSALYATVTVFPFIVTAVFWCVLAGNAIFDRFSLWANVSEHGLNSAFALFEVIVPRTDPIPWVHAFVLLAILGLYLGLSYISLSINHVYVYPFLNVDERGSTYVGVAVVLILVAVMIVFAIVHGIMLLRQKLTDSRPPKYSTHDDRVVERKAPAKKEFRTMIREVREL